MKSQDLHDEKIEKLKQQVQDLSKQSRSFSLHYTKGHSNTTRSKSYKLKSSSLDFSSLDQIIKIDPERMIATVEPRVTMEELTQETLKYHLVPYVTTEFKGITVGGAIMGGAAESSSHQFGIFSDSCVSMEMLCGDGSLMKVSQKDSPDIFYALSGSYGTFGALAAAEIHLIPAKEFIAITYHVFAKPEDAIQALRDLSHKKNPPDFLDGIVFSKDLAVGIEASFASKEEIPSSVPEFSLKKLSAPWYYEHVKQIISENKTYTEKMTVKDYLFRYDQGAFWMGSYLFNLELLARFVGQGILKLGNKKQERFTDKEIQKFCKIPDPNAFLRSVFHPIMNSQSLWKLLHKAEKWLQDKVVIQDFCIPEEDAAVFLKDVLIDPGTFPIWFCPIKGTKTPQIFAPHLLSEKKTSSHFINIGIYGLPSYYAPIEQITRKMEAKTRDFGGRKVLYSRSYYSEEEFWQIYSHEAYCAIREKTKAKVWHPITEKVLSR